MKTLRRLLLVVLALGVLGVGTLAGTSYYYGGDDGMGCARCHEIRPMVDAWAASSHRSVKCKDATAAPSRPSCACTRRTSSACGCTRGGEAPEQIHVRHQDVVPWSSAAGPAPPGARRLGERPPRDALRGDLHQPEHNANQQLMDDCLRCHAMHFEGGIRDLVTPLDRKGP